MKNVLNFPTKTVRDWLIIEREMKIELPKLGLSSASQFRVISRMKVFFEILNFELDYSFSIEWPTSLSRDQITSITSTLSSAIGEIRTK